METFFFKVCFTDAAVVKHVYTTTAFHHHKAETQVVTGQTAPQVKTLTAPQETKNILVLLQQNLAEVMCHRAHETLHTP